MNTKTTLPISEARKRIFELANEVQKPGTHYTFTEKGRPKAVLMSAEEYESLIETLEVMQDFPDLDKDIKEADEAFKSGEYKNWTTLDMLRAEHALAVAEKPKKKYNASTDSKAKSKKRVK